MLNRVRIFAAIERLLAERAPESVLAVMLLRIQGMRELNIRAGYEAGERMAEIARDLIERSLRGVDFVEPVGECDFLIVLPGLKSRNHAVLAATRLVRAFEEPLTLAGSPMLAKAAIGVALAAGEATTAHTLCRNAEIAYAEALHSGGRFAIYTPRLKGDDISYGDLREAILNNRLGIVFQPIVDLRTRAIVGAESLTRWQSAQFGEIGPSAFIPFAEQSGLITPLTRWSLNATLRECASARRVREDLTFAINLSPRVFAEFGMVEQVLGALEIWEVPPQSVILEVTETAIMDDLELSARMLERLRERGLRIAIDDFGTGYASFSYLRKFPATELKIDKSFVADMLSDFRTAQLVRSMIDTAHHLGLVAIAEGVEDEATLDTLISMGCDLAQGYLLGRPQAPDLFVASLGAAHTIGH